MNGSTFEIRNVRFATDATVPRDWHGGRKSVTRFFDNLSTFFPVGERFFIASVRAHMARVTDPKLAADVRAFNGQEGVHGREHDRYNAMVAAHGYPVVEMERRVARLLRLVSRATPKRAQLAATCALEHLTALMARFILEDPRHLEGAHPVMAALWRWHAAEENEHKAVAFDVYLAAGGDYPTRVVVMAAASLIFWAKVLEHQVRMMSVDGTAASWNEWASLGRFLFVEPGGMRRLLGPYLDYYRPGFHPDDLDSSEIVRAWRSDFETSPVYQASV